MLEEAAGGNQIEAAAVAERIRHAAEHYIYIIYIRSCTCSTTLEAGEADELPATFQEFG
jgi:hypothetical protein